MMWIFTCEFSMRARIAELKRNWELKERKKRCGAKKNESNIRSLIGYYFMSYGGNYKIFPILQHQNKNCGRFLFVASLVPGSWLTSRRILCDKCIFGIGNETLSNRCNIIRNQVSTGWIVPNFAHESSRFRKNVQGGKSTMFLCHLLVLYITSHTYEFDFLNSQLFSPAWLCLLKFTVHSNSISFSLAPSLSVNVLVVFSSIRVFRLYHHEMCALAPGNSCCYLRLTQQNTLQMTQKKMIEKHPIKLIFAHNIFIIDCQIYFLLHFCMTICFADP